MLTTGFRRALTAARRAAPWPLPPGVTTPCPCARPLSAASSARSRAAARKLVGPPAAKRAPSPPADGPALAPVGARARALLESLGYGAELAAADRAALRRAMPEKGSAARRHATRKVGAAAAAAAAAASASTAAATTERGALGGAAILKREASFALAGLVVTELPVGDARSADGVRARFRVERGSESWLVDSKVVFADGGQLKAADREAVAAIAARFAPPGSTVHLQADAHGAGNVFVGMIMCFGHERIPINLVSGDIGCGIAVFPVLEKARANDVRPPGSAAAAAAGSAAASRHARVRTGEDAAVYHAWVVAVTRRVLLRGQAAESGAFLASNLLKATAFYGFAELSDWLREMKFVLGAVGVKFADYEAAELDKAREQAAARAVAPPAPPAPLDVPREALLPPFGALSYEESVVLRYVSRFAQSLGSSGNHFLELAADPRGEAWVVVHSGSRALGAAVYEVVAEACRFLSGGFEVASGAMALFYQRAFDALNKFAKLNRVLCALAVLDATGHETGVAEMQAAMRASPLFAPAIARAAATDAAALALLSGVVHNGVACFVNDEARTVMLVLKKGAIAMTRGAAASVVALRAGDGCMLWTLADARCATREADIREGVLRLGEGYAQVFESPDVLFSGHGAGRARATGQTARLSTVADLAAFLAEAGVVANIAPGLLGDNPRIAYNDVPTIVARLPLAQACTHAQLRTIVAFKEGISRSAQDVQACADYVLSVWPRASDAEKLTLDLNVCRRGLGERRFADLAAERDAIFDAVAGVFAAQREG